MIAASGIDLGYPLSFYLAAALLVWLIVEAGRKFRRAWAIPAIMVYGTIAAWYLGNMVTRGPTSFLLDFGPQLTNVGLWQVILFALSYRLAIRWLLSNQDVPSPTASVSSKISRASVNHLFQVILCCWLALFIIGLFNAEWNLPSIIWPPSSETKVGMFTRGGIGQGADFLLSTGGYVYIALCSSFGVIAVISNGYTRMAATALYMLVLPYFLFDRTRNGMLAVLLPSVFCYLVATWGNWMQKAGICAALLALISLWFTQVMHYRGDTGEYRVSSLLDFTSNDEDESQLLGLDMLDELCHMDAFIQFGLYSANWGERYFAELANVVPRSLWKNKPLIGYDYAYARGFRNEDADSENAVYATVSTGIIGQGVANFGMFFGVIAAALIITGWTAILAKLWRRRFELPRFLLFLMGCGLTFNLGRDITLLVLWPFVFAYMLVRLFEKFQVNSARSAPRGGRPSVNISPHPDPSRAI